MRTTNRLRRVAGALGLAAALAGVAAASGSQTAPAADAPGPTEDRVGFPDGYQKFQVIRSIDIAEKRLVATVYANEPAASVSGPEQLPYPYGSIIVMEWRRAIVDSEGKPETGADGRFRSGDVDHVDVMRREKGFGAAYAANRAGEWEFTGYKPDRSYTTDPKSSASCAACHLKAGTARDFVFRGRLPASVEK